MHSILAMHTEDLEMNGADNTTLVEEPKYFLIWAAIWIAALAMLLPALSR